MVKETFSNDLAGYMGKSMTIMMDGMYPKMVSGWTKTKFIEMNNRGYFCGGTLPLGYRTEVVAEAGGFYSSDKEPPKRLVPNADAAPFVRRAFEVFAETRCITGVIAYLKGVTGRNWTYDSAKYLLTNETYLGIGRVGEFVNLTHHEPLVPQPLWDLVQEGLIQRTRMPKTQPKDTTAYHLRGLVFCPQCGCRMTPGDHHGRTATVRYYECIGAHKKKTRSCPTRRVNARSLHEAVLSEIRRAVQHPTRLTELVREAVREMPAPEGLKDQLTSLTRRLRETDKKIKNLLGAVENGGSQVSPLLRRLTELEEERAGLDGERQAVERRIEETRLRRPDEAQVMALWGRFLELWEAASDEERNDLLPLLVERVDMRDKEHGMAHLVFAPDLGVLSGGRGKKVNPTSGNVGFTSYQGAGAGLEPATFGL